jgi:hypothetical protein
MSKPTRENAEKVWKVPSAEKYMTVTLVKPFVWPKVPTDLTSWDKEMFDLREKFKEDTIAKQMLRVQPEAFRELNRSPLYPSAKSVKDQAKKLLRSKETWGGKVELDEKWQAAAAEEELEEELSREDVKASQTSEDPSAKDEGMELDANNEVYEEEEPKKLKWKPWLRRVA